MIDPVGSVTRFVYDPAGQVTALVQPGGETRTFTYDASGRLVRAVDPAGGATVYEYDPAGRCTATVDPFGRRWTLAYDQAGRVTGIADPLGNTARLAYLDGGRRIQVTDPTGATCEQVFDSLGRLMTETDPLGNSWGYQYDGRGLTTSVTDPLGSVTAFSYDGLGRLTAATDPLGRSQSWSYDTLGRLTAAIDGAGFTTAFGHDPTGRLNSVTDPLGNETTYGYSPTGALVSATDPSGGKTRWAYDLAGRPVSQTDPLGNTWTYAHSANGKLTTATNPNGDTAGYTYDPRGLPVGTTYSDGFHEELAYDAAGNLIRAASADATLTFAYDEAGRVMETGWAELNKTVRFTYDPAGRRTSLTDPEDRILSYRYDDAGRPVAFIDPDGHETLLSYDPAGRLTATTYPSGVTERRDYDDAGQLVKVAGDRPDGLMERYAYTYDDRGFVTRQVEDDGAETTWAYDPAGRLVRADYPADKIRAIRDLEDDRTPRVLAPATDEPVPPGNGGGKPGEGDSRPGQGGSEPGQGGSKPDKDGSDPGRGGSKKSATTGALPAQAVSSDDPAKNDGTGSNGNAGGNSGGNANANGQAKGLTEGAPIEASSIPDYLLPVREWVEYTYDGAGNRTAETSDLGTTLYTHDEAGRLLSAGDVTYEYDPAGRQVSRTSDGDTVLYGYDAADRLRAVTYEDGSGAVYGYDAFGRKVTRMASFWTLPDQKARRGPSEQGLENGRGHEQGNHNGLVNGNGHQGLPPGLAKPRLEIETTNYLWDGLQVLAEYAGEGAPLAEYYAVGGGSFIGGSSPDGSASRILARKMFGLHGRKEPGAPDLRTHGGLLYYTYDGLGNVAALTDRLGETVSRYRYDAFGGLLTSATAPYNLYGPFGKEFDPTAGLVYFGARWYDPAVGRFTTLDPVQGSIADPITRNRYLLAKANPANYVDRWGLHAEEDRYEQVITDDYRELSAWIWLASVETYKTYVVSQSPSEEILQHVYRHLHQYRYIDLRSERQVREDGFEYWELVKEIDYTYWATIEHDEWWEVNDLVGPKREEVDQEVGSAPGSWDVGDATEVVTNPLLYPGGLPDGQFPVGWGGQEVTSYQIEPPEKPGPAEQSEVLLPPIVDVSPVEAYRVLYEFLSFTGKALAGAAFVAAVLGTGGLVALEVAPSLGTFSFAASGAAWAVGGQTGDAVALGMGGSLGFFAADIYAYDPIASLAFWALSALMGVVDWSSSAGLQTDQEPWLDPQARFAP